MVQTKSPTRSNADRIDILNKFFMSFTLHPKNNGTRIGTVPDTSNPFRKAYTTVVLFMERSIMGRQTSIDGDPGMQAASINPIYLATEGTMSIEAQQYSRYIRHQYINDYKNGLFVIISHKGLRGHPKSAFFRFLRKKALLAM